MKRRLKGAPLTAAISLGIAVAAAALRGGFSAPDAKAGFQAWSDGFFIAGVLVGGVGLLSFAASDGLFDIIRYGVGKTLRLVLSKEKRDAYPKTFYDYRMLKSGHGFTGFSLLLAGLICIVMGGLFLFFYQRG